jgi:hypothetical protein
MEAASLKIVLHNTFFNGFTPGVRSSSEQILQSRSRRCRRKKTGTAIEILFNIC